MKSLSIIVVTLAVCMAAGAQSVNDIVPLAEAYSTISTNFTFSNTTNATVTTVLTARADGALYHTFNFFTTTSNFSAVVDSSLDNTNWVSKNTNAVTSAANAEYTLVGKYKFLRVRANGTNITGGVNYLGGR